MSQQQHVLNDRFKQKFQRKRFCCHGLGCLVPYITRRYSTRRCLGWRLNIVFGRRADPVDSLMVWRVSLCGRLTRADHVMVVAAGELGIKRQPCRVR